MSKSNVQLSNELPVISELLQLSKSAEFRCGNQARPTIDRCVSFAMACANRLAQDEDDSLRNMVVSIRVLRNMCVQSHRNQSICFETKAVHSVGAILQNCCTRSQTRGSGDFAAAGTVTPTLSVLRAIIQFFANCVTQHDDNQQVVWDLFLLPCLQHLFMLKDDKLNEFCSLCILKCVCDNTAGADERRHQLVDNAAVVAFLLTEILSDTDESDSEDEPADDDQESGDSNDSELSSDEEGSDDGRSSEPVLYKACDPNPGWALDTLECVLAPVDGLPASTLFPRLLKTATKVDEATAKLQTNVSGDVSDTSDSGNSNDPVGVPRQSKLRQRQVLELFRHLATRDADIVAPVVLEMALQALQEGAGTPANFLRIEWLHIVAQKLAASSTGPEHATVRDKLLEMGIVPVLLEALAQYPPPPPNAKTLPEASADGIALPVIAAFKQAIMQVVANLVFRHKDSQDAMREAGGLVLILNHSVLHPSYPLMREWALLAIRNVTEDNEANQSWIRSMKPTKAIPSAELEAQGVELVFDEASGSLKTHKKGSQAANDGHK